MNIKQKIDNSKENTWLSDNLTHEERLTAKYIAQIAASIQRQRKAKGYTQKELAKKLGVSQAMVSRWENGEENFTVATLARISSSLGLELIDPLGKSATYPSMVACTESQYNSEISLLKHKNTL